MRAATATPVFPISEQCDGFDFDPEMYYAQVLAEAGTRGRQEAVKPSLSSKVLNPVEAGDILSSKAGDIEKSVGDVKKKRSWKNTLFFWRKLSNRKKRQNKQSDQEMEIQAMPQRSGFKSRSGPIYMNDFHWDPPRRSTGTHSGPLSGTVASGDGELGGIPYMALRHEHPCNNAGASPSTAPLYLVT